VEFGGYDGYFVKTYNVVFWKRTRKRAELVETASVRQTRETIEFLDESGKIIRQFSKLEVKAFPIFADGDDPQGSVLS
jgi:hypothetical protein